MPENRKRSWKLLVISGDESNVRQLHIPRRAVVLLVGTIALLIMYAAVETVLFWIVARRAAEVEPLRKRVRELESSNSELARLGKDLEQLQAFERQLRRVLSGRESALSTTLPWQRSTFEPYGDEVGSVVELGAAKSASPVGDARSLGGACTAMDMPTVPPVRGFVTRTFVPPGPRRSLFHQGLDIAAREGTPVLATADGLVLFAEWTYRYGHWVVIAHRSGYVSFYGHNQALLVRAGDRVRQGEPIALVGNSGLSSAPHLHFELWLNGSPVDPLTLMAVGP